MIYEVTVRDFAKRTRKNLKKIEELSLEKPNEYFEVTQLVNSAIGLLMFPQQEFFNGLPETAIEELRKSGWPIPDFEYGAEKTPNLREIARYIRNSFAHYNIDFKADGRKIEGIYLWNRQGGHGPVNWLCYISVPGLRELFLRLARLAERMPA